MMVGVGERTEVMECESQRPGLEVRRSAETGGVDKRGRFQGWPIVKA